MWSGRIIEVIFIFVCVFLFCLFVFSQYSCLQSVSIDVLLGHELVSVVDVLLRGATLVSLPRVVACHSLIIHEIIKSFITSFYALSLDF